MDIHSNSNREFDKNRFTQKKLPLVRGKNLMISMLAVSLISALTLTFFRASLFSIGKKEESLTILSDLNNSNEEGDSGEEGLFHLLKKERSEQAKKMQILKNELISTRERLEQLKADLMVRGYSTEKVLKQKIESLETSLDKAQQEISALYIELRSKQEALEAKRKELENATSIFLDNLKRQSEELEQKDNNFKNEQAKSRSLINEVSTLKSLLEEKQSTLEKMTIFEKEVLEASVKIGTLEEMLRKTADSLMTEREENASLKEGLESEKEAKQELQQEMSYLKEKLQEENYYAESLVQILEERALKESAKEKRLGSALFDLSVLLSQEQSEKEAMKEKFSSQEEQFESLKNSLEKQHQEALTADAYEKQVGDLEDKFSEVQQRVEQLEILRKELISPAELAENLSLKNQQIEELTERLSQQIAENEVLKSAFESYENKNKESLTQQESLLSNELKLAIEKQEEHELKARQAIAELEKALEDQEIEKGKADELLLKLKQSSHEQEEEKKRADDLVRDNEELKQSLETASKNNEWLEQALYNLRSHQETQQEEINELKSYIEIEEEKNRNLIQELQDLKLNNL